MARSVNIIETDVTDNENLMQNASAYEQAHSYIMEERTKYNQDWTPDRPKMFPGVTALECSERYSGKSANAFSQLFSRDSKVEKNTFVKIDGGRWDIKYERDKDMEFLNQSSPMTF